MTCRDPLVSAAANHEQVVICHDGATGLHAIIAIHDTTLGPALGGTRMWPYESEDAALRDALRLSHGMTFKSALADLPYGGGKAVIIGDPYRDKSPELFHAFGRYIDRFGGHFITGEDVGMSMQDLEEIRKETVHVRGIAEGRAGEGAPTTAWGVFKGIETAVEHRFGAADLSGLTVCIQGLGHVGMELGKLLRAAGANLFVADIRAKAVAEACAHFGATSILAEKAHAADCDVFAPCALGGVLNWKSIPEIRAPIVAGSANNQLAETADGARLKECGILYAPDYVINAGGVISIAHEGPDFDHARMLAHVAQIGETLTQIFARAEAEDIPTSLAADQLAQERIAS